MKRKPNYLKHVLQWGVLAAIAVTVIWSSLADKAVDVEKYCPFGGLQAFGTYLVNNSLACSMSMLQIMMGLALAVGVILLSKLFCGYLCPLGTVGEAMGRIGKKLHVQVEIRSGSVADRLLRVVKYVLLFTILYNTLSSSELFCKQLDPYYAVATGFKGEIVLWMSLTSLVLLLLGGFVVKMFWCKYICPLGAASNIFKFTWLLLAAACGTRPFTVRLTGDRTDGSYIRMTLSLLPSFGCEFSRSGEEITVFPRKHAPCAFFETEPDLSAACYFYALSLLFGVKVTVRGVSSKTAQGDFSFLRLLEARGVRLTDTPQGLLADGSEVGPFRGFDENMHDFSDQALTVAALAPFASSPSRISGVGHIRFQECDRIAAIQKNLTAIGVPVTVSEDAITVFPAPVRGGRIETFSDHRVAMAFTLIGLKTGGIEIADPDCTGKTFEGYFDLITSLTD